MVVCKNYKWFDQCVKIALYAYSALSACVAVFIRYKLAQAISYVDLTASVDVDAKDKDADPIGIYLALKFNAIQILLTRVL